MTRGKSSDDFVEDLFRLLPDLRTAAAAAWDDNRAHELPWEMATAGRLKHLSRVSAALAVMRLLARALPGSRPFLYTPTRGPDSVEVWVGDDIVIGVNERLLDGTVDLEVRRQGTPSSRTPAGGRFPRGRN